EMLLLERHRRELRIRADRADGDKLRHARLPRLVKQVRAHHQVVVEELAGPLAIGADAADNSREMDDERRLGVMVDANHLRLIAQVVVAVRRREDRRAVLLLQLADDMAAEKTGAPGDQNALCAPETHRWGRAAIL